MILLKIDFKTINSGSIDSTSPEASSSLSWAFVQINAAQLCRGLDYPTSGDFRLDGKYIMQMKEEELARLRGAKFDFIFQSFHLIPVSQRTHEIGIRIAHRAPLSAMLRTVLLIRVGVGLAISLAATLIIASQLFGVTGY